MTNPLDPWQEAHHRAPTTMSSDAITAAMTELADARAERDDARAQIRRLSEGWWTLEERDRARATAITLWDELHETQATLARALTLADTWANTDLGDDYGTHHVTQAQVDAVVAMGEELRAALDGEQ